MTRITDLENILQDLDWTYVRSDNRKVELISGGYNKPVTFNDVERYLQLYGEARLNEGKEAVSAFRGGLVSIIPESAFILLSWETIEKIVCGSRSIDIQRLKENTEYDDDVTPDDAHVIFRIFF